MAKPPGREMFGRLLRKEALCGNTLVTQKGRVSLGIHDLYSYL